jgi:hypothetical protein
VQSIAISRGRFVAEQKRTDQNTEEVGGVCHVRIADQQQVRTTRPRITMFMQRFRNLGLIETNIDRVSINQRVAHANLFIFDSIGQ